MGKDRDYFKDKIFDGEMQIIHSLHSLESFSPKPKSLLFYIVTIAQSINRRRDGFWAR